MSSADETDAVVVGSGPNGLAAAVVLARAGLAVRVYEAQDTLGGGARTLDLGLGRGVRHDICSAVHPMALASPFFQAFDLPARGVELIQPEIAYAQAFPGRAAAVAYRDLDRTSSELSSPGWKTLLRPLVASQEAVTALALGDQRSIPPGLVSKAGLRFGAQFAARLTRLRFDGAASLLGDDGAALLAGVAAHQIGPLRSCSAAAVGLTLSALAHAVGWPIPRGGSQSLVDALVADLLAHGASVRTGCRIAAFESLPRARAYLFDCSPRALARLLGDRLPGSVRAGLLRYPYGNAATKVDFVLNEPVPWADERLRRAGTVHMGGSAAQVASAERDVAAGRHAPQPVVLVSQPASFDPSRVGSSGQRPLWTYAHVPSGSDLDMTQTVIAQIERAAPGFRDTIAASQCVPAARLAEHNENYIDGDIAVGAISLYRLFARPRPAWNPYRTGQQGVYLCSSATPPGPGVHGMAGLYAARAALRERFAVREMPELGPRPGPAEPGTKALF
ncbi:FAD dependent oxidoreductase [Segniliparus rotundus DSM 44985]|uniref:FAD dependent oxidoreductase n=1 Tax=Segniliparus rotundus (strain ATCC BAA-972 / CDC 1076 / CIP 108378 / DSM 44985 / JCM 13578) TaxID=640132 RepID=D6Z859_SEGRD|nr:NAD(P)/FAD-dependent oxidoreductase [Segniliparus rotundus]ADG98139.1 FAD dependent oxidoreductase [Segniliparus rotundus DSM 44985]